MVKMHTIIPFKPGWFGHIGYNKVLSIHRWQPRMHHISCFPLLFNSCTSSLTFSSGLLLYRRVFLFPISIVILAIPFRPRSLYGRQYCPLPFGALAVISGIYLGTHVVSHVRLIHFLLFWRFTDFPNRLNSGPRYSLYYFHLHISGIWMGTFLETGPFSTHFPLLRWPSN